MDHLVGTSGWVYPDWRERVYPPGLPQARWLAHYATRFPTVEVNATFYRLARATSAARWVSAVPPEFRFTVKGSRYLTHLRRLADVEAGVARFFEPLRPLGDHLTAVLWQLPPTMQLDLARLDHFLAALPRHVQHAVEFRHPSWQTDEVLRLLDDHGAMTVAVSGPQLPPWKVVTGRRAYLRLHGLEPGYSHEYTEAELRPWAEWLRTVERALVYFDNDVGGAAVRNAELFVRLLETSAGRISP